MAANPKKRESKKTAELKETKILKQPEVLEERVTPRYYFAKD